MATVTITSDQKIKEIHIVFAEDGAAVVDVRNNSSGVSPQPYQAIQPEPQAAPEFEIDHADFDSIVEGGLPPKEDNRKTVGESFEGVDLDAPLTQSKIPSAIVVKDIEDRPAMVDTGMGTEL